MSSDSKKFRQLTPQEILKECGFSSSDRNKYARICGRYLQKSFGDRHRSNGKTLYWVPPILPGHIGGIPTDPFGGQGGDSGGYSGDYSQGQGFTPAADDDDIPGWD